MPKKDAPELYCLDTDAIRQNLERASVSSCRLRPLTPPQAIWVRGTFDPRVDGKHVVNEIRSAA